MARRRTGWAKRRSICSVASPLLAATAMLLGPAAAAQVQPIPQQQLEKGFLGEQNARLSSQDAPSDAPYTVRAAAALAQQDYARALAILRPYRLSQEVEYHYLAGRAHQGLGNLGAARKELAIAIKKRKNYLAAQLALGLLEAEQGDAGKASQIVAGLKDRQTGCAGKCREAAELDAAINAIDAALRGKQG